MRNRKETYEKPNAEIIEFELADYLASSADTGFGLACSEMEWG